MHLNIKAKKQRTYDAIVVGTGISGGWAAKELTENGLDTLVLERGRNVRHPEDYPTANKEPWGLPRGDRISAEEAEDYEVQMRTGYTVRESTKHWWVKDTDQPYEEKKRFDWIRGYHVGGRSIMWGRQCLRWSPMDFEANARDGVGVDWPIRYEDIEPWYDHVEEFIGVSGQKEGLAQLPDGQFLPPFEMNCAEEHARERIMEAFDGERVLTMGRFANLTRPHNGRGACQYRNRCMRGCPYGAYFSSNSSTLPAAEATGNMTLRPHSIVNRVIYDEEGRATGVEVIDAESGDILEFYARIIFLNASCINSTLILLNSTSNRFPDGLGNDSGELGHNLMDHHFRVGASGVFEGFEDKYYYGRRPASVHMPRFRNLPGEPERDYLRGFHFQGAASRQNWWRGLRELAIGEELKEFVTTPGRWTMGLNSFGEMLPHHDNRLWLNHDEKDKWGQPTLVFDVEFGENEYAMREEMKNDAAEMLEAGGFKDVTTYDDPGGPGLAIHEMGTARMGRDPKTSVLNRWNQVHSVENVFVTDGACMTSSACQNPSLTYMALTARAANYAAEELRKDNL